MNQHEEQIILDKLNHLLEDEIEFNRLMQRDDFRRLYEEYEKIAGAGKQHDLKRSFRKSNSWEYVRDRTVKQKTNVSIGVWKRYVGYAAAVLIPLMIGYGMWFMSPPETDTVKEFAILHDIKAGSQNALLVRGDGSVIDLLQVSDSVLTERDGTDILRKEGSRMLVYQQTNRESVISVTNRILTPYGSEYQIQLEDGTQVWVNAGSELVYPTCFTGKERRVKLQGEAYFEVAPDKDRPFIVENGKQQVRVLGTHFNMKAYDDDRIAQTTLAEGRVQVEITGTNGRVQALVLNPGEQSVFNKESGKLNKQMANLNACLAWINGRFSFRDDSLEDILIIMSRWYKIGFKYDDEKLKEIKFTGDLKKYNDITDILGLIEKLSDVKFKPGKEVIIVTNR